MENFTKLVLTSLQGVLDKVFGFIPNLLGAVFVFMIGYFLVRFFVKLLGRILEKPAVTSSLSKLVEGLGVGGNIDASKTILKVVNAFFMLIVILTATDVLGVDILSQLLSQLVQYVPKLLSAIVMFILGVYGSGLIRSMVSTALKSMGVRPWRMLGNIIFYFLLIAITISSLGQAGIDTQFITANITIMVAGIMIAFAAAYGFAARNILAGILTSFYNKNHFEVGQVIEVEGEKGEITSIDTVSVTLDNGTTKTIVPMYKLLNEKVIIYK